MDKFHALLFAFVFSVVGTAVAEPTAAPLGVIKRSFDSPADADKYVYMFGGPGAGASWAGGVIHWRYNNLHQPTVFASDQAAINQIQASMNKWHAAGCNVTFVNDGPSSNG